MPRTINVYFTDESELLDIQIKEGWKLKLDYPNLALAILDERDEPIFGVAHGSLQAFDFIPNEG